MAAIPMGARYPDRNRPIIKKRPGPFDNVPP